MRSQDVIVVGAGTAGCVLAARLSEDPSRRVLLVEAGPDHDGGHGRSGLPPDVVDAFAPTVGHDWGYVSEPDPLGRRLPLPRARLVGGCGATNAAFAVRGHPADYDGWAASGNPGWSFRDLLPVFRGIESDADITDEWHGSAGPVPIRRDWAAARTPLQEAFGAAALAAGYAFVPDHNHPGAVGVGPGPRNVVDGVRISTALAYLGPARGRPNLVVRPDAVVDRLCLAGDRVRGVVVDGVLEVAARVVLAAGSYASPAILLRSGIGDPAHLRTLGIRSALPLPGVGEHLSDHPLGGLVVPCGAVAPAPVFHAFATWRSPYADLEGPPDTFLAAGGPFPETRSPTGAAFVLSYALLAPHGTGTVRLRSADPSAPPVISPGHLCRADDVLRMVAGHREACRLLAHDALAGLARGPAYGPDGDDLVTVEDHVRRSAATFHHPVGTCLMGPDPAAGAVVDGRCRVHGLDGAYVVDASVMPAIPSAPTNLTTIAIAERAATWLCEDP